MTYTLFPVQHPALAPYIEALWHIDMQVPYGCEKILPTATLELIINFGDSFRVQSPQNPHTVIHTKDAWLVGIQTEHLINEIMGHSHMIGIRFKPGGIVPFFAHPASDFHNQIVELDAIWGRFAVELREQLLNLPDIAARLRHVEQALLQRLSVDERRYLPIQFAVQQLQKQRGAVSIKTLSETIGYSQKHLGNQFKQIVGITPKMLARVYRFQQVLQHIQPRAAINWTDLALSCHYHDQAHFNKEFAAFSGLTPTQYIAHRASYVADVSTDESGHFVPIG